MVTLLIGQGATEVAGDGGKDALWLTKAEAERATGWSLKPEGLCRGEICIPVPPKRAAEFAAGGRVNIAAFWRHMDRPALHSESGDVWLLGDSAAERAAALSDLQAPDFTLPDLDGKPHSLSDYRGKKVFLTTWASW